MRTILKQFALALILVIMPIYSYSQKMKVTYQEAGASSSVHAISNGDNVSLGNLGDNFTGLYGKIYYIKIKNTDSANDLIISNVKLGNNRYITLSDFNKVSVITTSNEYQIFMAYQVPGTITRETTFIEFNTNDPLNSNVRINFIANPDNGEFTFTAEAPYTINNNTIDIGNIKLNESVNINYWPKNIGSGHAGLSEVKDIVTNNKLTSSFNKYTTFAHNAAQQIGLTFQAKTPGDINTQFTHEITKGKVAKRTFRITGKVIIPQLQITNGGTVVNEGDEVVLPEIVYSSGTSWYTRSIPIENIGGDILRISKFTIEGDNDNEFLVSGTTYFNANSKGSINVRISPHAHGERRIKIKIKSNSHSNPDTYIYAKVVIRAPYLSLLDEDGKTYNYNDEFMVGTSTGGNKITKNLIFKNTGNRTMNISRLYIELLGDDKAFSITNTPKKSLAPNEQTNVTIEYNPKAISKKENPKTRLYIMANTMKIYYSFGIKAGNSYSDVLLKKNSTNYKNTSTLVFDKVSVNNPYTETLTLTNSGNTDLNLSNFSITDDNSNYFSIVEPSSDIVVKPGENINLKIKFTPKIKVNDYKAKLKFTTNDYEDPNFTLNLQGASIKPTIKVYDPSNNDITHNSVTNKVTITHPLTKTVQYNIRNYGADKLRVTDITVDTPDGITAKVIYNDTELDFGKSNQLSIEYKATKPGHYKTKVKLKTNDYEAPEFVFYNSFIAMVPSLEVATDKVIANNSSVDFGNNAILEFSLRNAGSHTLNINSVTIDGADKDNFTVKASSNTIVSNTDIKAVVIYRPDRSGVKTANLIINSDDPVNPLFTIVLKADDNTPAPAEPDLDIKHKGSSISSNQNIDFGTTTDATEEFTIKNSGKGVLDINSITISGANKSDFNISSYNKSVDTGKETTFRVTYRSDAVGKKSAVVTISTNDNDTPSFIINVTAETKKSTSIDNIDSDMFSVYPNPFSDHITISNTEGKEFMVNIYNINGVKIISKKVTDTTVSITTDIPSGIYIVEILRDNRTYRYKVIRE